jgi:hypothetical protein
MAARSSPVDLLVIASEAKQSSFSFDAAELDCFASLAMTAKPCHLPARK